MGVMHGMLAMLQQLSLSLCKRSEVLGLARIFLSLSGDRSEGPGDNAQPVRCDGGWMPSFLDFPWHNSDMCPRESLPGSPGGLTPSSHDSVSSLAHSFLTSVPSTWPLPPTGVTLQSDTPICFRVYSFEDPRLRQWEFCNNNLFFLCLECDYSIDAMVL